MDKTYITQKMTTAFHKTISYPIGSKKVRITISELISGGVFLFMGVLIIALDLLGKLAMQDEYQRQMKIFIINTTDKVNNFLKFIPGYAWIMALVIFLALITIIAFRYFRKVKNEKQ
jgi:hypothetical protein